MWPFDFKIVVIGMEHAGKTSLLQRFVLDQFSVAFGYRATLGASFLTKKIDLTDGADGSVTESCNIGVWDVAGTERFRSMSKFHFSNAFAAIVCYDVTSAESWKSMCCWLDLLQKTEPNCRVFICANKIDLVREGRSQRAISYNRAVEFAEEQKATYFETSSKTGEQVAELFEAIARKYLSSEERSLLRETRISHTASPDDDDAERASGLRALFCCCG